MFLMRRSARTERWLRYIFEVKGDLDDDKHKLLAEKVLDVIEDVYKYPVCLEDENDALKATKQVLSNVVMDELGGLMEGLRIA